MFFDAVKNIAENGKLHSVVLNSFEKAFNTWMRECPDEANKYKQQEIYANKLNLNSIEIKESQNPNYNYSIIAEYHYVSEDISIVYTLKFWDEFIVYDDVFYIK